MDPQDSHEYLKKVEDVAEVALKKLLNSDQKEEFVFPRSVVQKRWNIIEKIGSGGFGAIYRAHDTVTKQSVAIKVEKRVGKSYLDKEVVFYKKLQTGEGVPKVHWYGMDGTYKVAVFDLMGPSLSDLFYSCQRRFSLKTVLMLADQLITRLEYVHTRGIVHRDVKPGNFVMGRGDKEHQVYVIDFGLSNNWRESSGLHIKYNQDSAFRGTHRYASINSHFKSEQSRRDDLEALGYVLIYFLKGGLPWQSLKVARNKRRKSIGKFKQRVPLVELTKGLPNEFATYMAYVKSLKFEDVPDYDYLRGLFQSCRIRNSFALDYVYDWTNPKEAPSSSLSISEDKEDLRAKTLPVEVISISSNTSTRGKIKNNIDTNTSNGCNTNSIATVTGTSNITTNAEVQQATVAEIPPADEHIIHREGKPVENVDEHKQVRREVENKKSKQDEDDKDYEDKKNRTPRRKRKDITPKKQVGSSSISLSSLVVSPVSESGACVTPQRNRKRKRADIVLTEEKDLEETFPSRRRSPRLLQKKK